MFLLQRVLSHRRVSSHLSLSESRSIPRYGDSQVQEQRVAAQKTQPNPNFVRVHSDWQDARLEHRSHRSPNTSQAHHLEP